MNISGIKNQTFKGYDARPIKNLYMQKSTVANQDNVYKELYSIGQDVGFDVHMNYICDHIAHNPDEIIDAYKTRNRNPWAQDNKLFLKKGKRVSILYPKKSNDSFNFEAANLAQKLDVKATVCPIRIEGGNIFLGTKNDGEPYAIVGMATLTEPRIDEIEDDDIEIPHTYVQLDKNRLEEACKEKIRKLEDSKKELAKYLGIKKENLYVIKQPAFHLDYAIRPLKYPYVLVNDFNEVDKSIGKMKLTREILDGYHEYRAEEEFYGYSRGDETVEELKKHGFKPIKIAGVYSNSVNFMNAIVHEKNDGSLCYITNACRCKKPAYGEVQDAFKKELKKKTGIEDVRFVAGGYASSGNNYIMNFLKYFSGGVHCLFAEEPNFDVKV